MLANKKRASYISTHLVKVADLGAGKTVKQVMEMAYMIVYLDLLRSKVSKKWMANKIEKDWYGTILS